MGIELIVGGIIGLVGLGVSTAGTIAGAVGAAEDARTAEAFAQERFDITVENINEQTALAIEQGQEQANLAISTQNENFAALLGSARETAGLRTEGVTFQEGFQTTGASRAGTREAGQIGARTAVSGAGGRSSDIIRRTQRGITGQQIEGIGAQADLSRLGIATGLSQTEEEATRRLSQNLESISLRQGQFEESALSQQAIDLEQAELARRAALEGIPTTGEIGGAAALDVLSSGLDFGSTLVDLFD